MKNLKNKYGKYAKYILWIVFFVFLIVIGMQSNTENSVNSNARQNTQNIDATPKALLDESLKRGEQFGNQISNYYEQSRKDYIKEKAWEEYKETNRFHKMICRQAKQGKELVLECEFEIPSREKFEKLYNEIKGGVK